MADIKITYFNLAGRAELSRLILAQAGVKFTDERIAREDFVAMKPTLPNGQLPILTFNGTVISQSITMARFLANEYNLAGKTNLEKAHADEVIDTLLDVMNSTLPPIMKTKDEEEKKELIAKLVEKAGELFGKLSKRLESRDAKFFVGDSLTWADICFYQFSDMVKMFGVTLDNNPILKELSNRVAEMPNIKQWVDNRPQ